uniref:Protein NYNRIN-like n=1 Tax=Tanacetum cinerariifolium TaxID=118510 RepID=A0A6L2K865_TANCI|nr:protein NYNRIN-like [Tanacetum cinerariifolium]
MSDDLRLARQINALCDALTDVIDGKESFVVELDMLVGKFVPRKMAEFMMHGKDILNLIKLQILRREFELRAHKKDLFIDKLKAWLDGGAPDVDGYMLAVSWGLIYILYEKICAAEDVPIFLRKLECYVMIAWKSAVATCIAHCSDEVLESIEIIRRMHLKDIKKASRLLLMAREVQNKRAFEEYFDHKWNRSGLINLAHQVAHNTEEGCHEANEFTKLRSSRLMSCLASLMFSFSVNILKHGHNTCLEMHNAITSIFEAPFFTRSVYRKSPPKTNDLPPNKEDVEGEELALLMGYRYKCFLRLPKDNSQIRMAEDDEDKTKFHTEEGVYCFTRMPKGLENSAATLQRMMEKVLPNRKGRNVEVCLKEIVVKNKSEQMLDANEEETSKLGAKLQADLSPTPRACGIYPIKEIIKDGSGVGMILINLEEKTCLYAIRLNFNAPNNIMNYKALLAGLVASAGKEMLTGLATIQLEFLNKEVSVGIKTRPTVEMESDKKERRVTGKMPIEETCTNEHQRKGMRQLPQRSNEDIQLEMAKLIKNNRILLNKNIFPHEEASMGVLLAKERILKLIQSWDEKQIESWSLPELLPQLLNDSRTIDEMLKQPWERFSEIKHAFKDKQYQPKEIQELMRKLLEDLQIIRKELAEYINSLSWNHPTFYNDDEEHSIQYKDYLENSSNAITTVLPTEEHKYSLSMGEYEVTSDDESECDVPVKDESSSIFTTFSNPTFDDNDDFTSSNYELLFEEDISMENFIIYSNPLFDDEEINSNKIDSHYFNAESDLIESLSNRDTLFDSSPKFDYLEEFSGELMPASIVNEERIKREHEEYISLMKKLLTINSFSRPLENFHANMIIETLPTSLIPVEDGDSLREEIDIFTGTDDLMPPGIESDDYDSEGDIHFLEELISNDSISLLKIESSNFDHHDDPSFPRPPPEPLDVEVFFDFEPNSGELISAVMNNIDELNEEECFYPRGGEINVFTNIKDDDYFPFIFAIQIFLPYLTYPEVFPLLLSTRSEDTIFDPGIST